MVGVYSHSKLGLYENCPEAYKVKYINKTFPELPQSIQIFLGSAVHDALEHLYSELMKGKVLNLDEVIEHFAKSWHDQYTLDIRIPISERVEDFFNKGVKFLIDYYQSNLPFSKNTIDIERKIFFPLKEDVFIVGYIDRLEKHEDGSYEVHDYKTNDRMKSQEDVDQDRQLAFYQLGLQDSFGEKIKVKLTWHFLAHKKKVHSFRTQEQLDKLKRETLELIDKINKTKEWSACGKPWCDWCAYKKIHGAVDKKEGKGANASGLGDLNKAGGGIQKIFTLNDSLGKWL